MKKIHITESQKQMLVKMLKENSNSITVAYQKPANGMATTSDMANQMKNAKSAAPNSDVNLEVSSKDLNLECYTKKQIKDAKVRKMMDECEMYTKKDLRRK